MKGTKLSLSNGEITPFEIKLDASSAKGLSRFGKPVPKDNQDIFKTDARGHSYFGERRFDIYQQPNKSSAILQKNIKVTNKGFKLVEIGSVETDFLPGSWKSKNIWYRIQNGQVDGWVFGLLTAA